MLLRCAGASRVSATVVVRLVALNGCKCFMFYDLGSVGCKIAGDRSSKKIGLEWFAVKCK